MPSYSIDPKGITEVQQLFADLGKDAPRAMIRSINKTLPGVRTDIVNALYERYMLTKTTIRKSFTVKKAFSARPTGTVQTTGRRLHLSDFQTRQTKKGVTVRVLRGGKLALFAQAWLWEFTWGTTGSKDLMLQRKWHGNRQNPNKLRPLARLPYHMRYPVRSLYGPRIQDRILNPAMWDGLEKQATDRFIKAATHEADRLIKQKLESGDGFTDNQL